MNRFRSPRFEDDDNVCNKERNGFSDEMKISTVDAK
jgi:hypothetical protein